MRYFFFVGECKLCRRKLPEQRYTKFLCVRCSERRLFTVGMRGERYLTRPHGTENLQRGIQYVRSLVRKRDNYTCQKCGLVRTPEQVLEANSRFGGHKGKIKSLDVHHLNGLCGKRSRSYDRVEDMPGLVTLCHKCHYNHPEHSSKLKTQAA